MVRMARASIGSVRGSIYPARAAPRAARGAVRAWPIMVRPARAAVQAGVRAIGPVLFRAQANGAARRNKYKLRHRGHGERPKNYCHR